MEDDEYSAIPSKAAHPLIVNAEEYQPMAQSPTQVTLKAPPPYSVSKLLTRSIVSLSLIYMLKTLATDYSFQHFSKSLPIIHFLFSCISLPVIPILFFLFYYFMY